MNGATPIPAPIIVAAVLGDADQAWLNRLRRAHFPPGRNQLPAHLTMFHHLPPSTEGELRHRLSQAARNTPPPPATLAAAYSLGRGVAFRIESPALEAIRDYLADVFRMSLTSQDSAGWRPHVTIQNKVEPAAAKALLAELARDFRCRPLAITGLAAHWYRGGPWEPLSRHMFAG